LTEVDIANPRKRRDDRLYCSDACKLRAFRERKNQAATVVARSRDK
jgi:hypothetical protein